MRKSPRPRGWALEREGFSLRNLRLFEGEQASKIKGGLTALLVRPFSRLTVHSGRHVLIWNSRLMKPFAEV